MTRLNVSVFFTLWIMAWHQAWASQDPWLDFDGGNDVMLELVSGVIDYASLRTAMEIRPDILRAKLLACGTCDERAALEQSLAIAERERQVIGSLESAIAQSHNMDPWTAWKLGIKIRPEAVQRQPEPCIALYDKAYSCSISHDDRSAGDLGKACHAEHRLHRLCAEGDARPFYEYVGFLRKKERGETVFETEDNRSFYYYNVKPDMTLPPQVVPAEQSEIFYSITTDSTQPGTLRSLMISGVARVGPNLKYSSPDAFRPPWSSILHKDNVAIPATARTIECHYVLPEANRVRAFKFWYRERPASADPSYLNSRMQHHPLLRVGEPVDNCPANASLAEAILPLVSDATLKAQYGDMLVQPSESGTQTSSPLDRSGGQDAAAERAKARQR
jgi:hypothetical protein